MKIIRMLKKVLIHIRTSIKVISLTFVATFFIFAALTLIYKPIYSVCLNGEFVGYSKDKSKLQARINEYIQKGDSESIAFVKVDSLPEYKMCLLKKGITTNDDEIFAKIQQTGIDYYTYYAILQDGQEKLYVSNYEEAQTVVQGLKDKNSENADRVTMQEKYTTELKKFTGSEQAVSELYVEKKKAKSKTQVASNVSTRSSSGRYTATTGGTGKIASSFIEPISGKLSSRFNSISSIRSGAHTGLDIAAPFGTSIKAAAGGKVTYAGWKGSYGNLIIVSHGDGTETWYGHCSSLVASAGQSVGQGQVIAKVGSTGNSTGNHLHLEIRINGTPVNPQRYVY